MFERKLYRADMLRCVLCSDAPCSNEALFSLDRKKIEAFMTKYGFKIPS